MSSFIQYLVPFIFVVSLSAAAQDSTQVKRKWNFPTEAYMMFPGMSGTIGVGTLPDANLDVDAGDIFSHFQMGAMFYAEATNDLWSISTDIVYMHLKQDIQPGKIINSGDATVKQLVWEAAGMYKLLPWLDGGAGLRFNALDTKLEMVTKNVLTGATQNRSKSISESWVDPFIVARIKSEAGKKFIYQFRADIGGFGIGSDLAWQIQATAGYRFSKLFQITGGYRILSADYENGAGEERFKYDVDTFGPLIKFGFNF